ncbi:TetR/AcrR family transcriptional regulator [Acrocarpospora catenulata]|uniref:TetR/AcrR family transcriptional regulator n=1 Tax=Acrocarpospora catenulata TaxID=2836182 RepID=UPI001BDA294C|nr:helix-turn-helix domain-containing protein [Acrocarpospora catenulata]
MKSEGSRSYRMTVRAATTARTGEQIVSAALALYHELWLDEITVEQVAARAGVSSKTVLRRYGSRDGLLTSVAGQLAADVAEQRFAARVGDLDDAVNNLMAHYERNGRLALRNLVQAQRSRWIASLVDHARAEHAQWVSTIFAPFLARDDDVDRELLRVQLTAVTDIAMWNVLRNELGLSPARTEQAIAGLLCGLLREDHP